MKRFMMLVLFGFLFGIGSITEVMAKTQGNNNDPIEWEYDKKNADVRSILLISGQVDENIVTVYLYESPGEATVQIQDESGCIIYNNVYIAPSILTIDLNGQESGTYQITVEYEGKVFVGSFGL